MEIDEKALAAATTAYWSGGAISANIPKLCIETYLAALATQPQQAVDVEGLVGKLGVLDDIIEWAQALYDQKRLSSLARDIVAAKECLALIRQHTAKAQQTAREIVEGVIGICDNTSGYAMTAVRLRDYLTPFLRSEPAQDVPVSLDDATNAAFEAWQAANLFESAAETFRRIAKAVLDSAIAQGASINYGK